MFLQILTSLILSLPLTHAISGTGKSTRYWDCCKPSCSWPSKANVTNPVSTCDKSSNILTDASTKSGCDSGTAYMCANQIPWSVNSALSYGFAATALSGQKESDWCCGCYAVTFTSGKAKGKTMLIQSTNTGGDLADNQFDIAMPGGGLGIFDGCSSQFGGLGGSRYGGVSNRSDCDSFPPALKPGCQWRFDWFNNADNPTHQFTQIRCPSELVSKTNCRRLDDDKFPIYTPTVSVWASPTPTVVAKQWEQCDSLLWDAQAACPSGTKCVRVTDCEFFFSF
ncbi:uncharacterized protein BDR25DRAFT_213635 [Lindgomyces ingoldianus]|uniref:Uncharacterized protein n=1 Tax=Lindgomyces ingoldianus TaxID=673940 RepID=A0ACB6RAN0_9PLEO|nr:uncharacterized protein BDR25DRAFT_213635 [Lindgomyces ingoldianus]KAF2475587.1 hypothetical protein BDR25DRAFT_213635 [Lindgomyces ingoldianus]